MSYRIIFLNFTLFICKQINMEYKKNIIAFRIGEKLKQALTDLAVKETTKRNKIIKVSDIVREILEEKFK